MIPLFIMTLLLAAVIWFYFKCDRILDEAKELYRQAAQLDSQVTEKIREENMVLVLHYKAVLQICQELEYFELCDKIHKVISDKTDFEKVDPIEGIYFIQQPRGMGVIFDEEIKK